MALIIPHRHNDPSISPTSKSLTHVRLVEVEDKALNMLLATKTTATHLKKGETVVLVGLEEPEHLVKMLTMTGTNAEAAIKKGKLFIFSTQPAIDHHLSHHANYQPLFAELVVFTNVPIDCIVMLDVDALFNLDSQYYAYSSVSQFMQAADEVGCKVFAQYIKHRNPNNKQQHYLATACDSLVDNYLLMERNRKNSRYHLRAKKKIL